MQPNEFIPGFVLVVVAFFGWKLMRATRSRRKAVKVAGLASGLGIVCLSGCLLLLYGCGIAMKYRSVPAFSPDGKHMAQVTELSLWPDPLNTTVELRSRWQIFPERVFQSVGSNPWEMELKWRSNSELLIRYAPPPIPTNLPPLMCLAQFKAVKITCEPIEGYKLRSK